MHWGATENAGALFLSDRPDEWRFAARSGSQAYRDMPAATGGEALKQTLQYPRAGRMIIGHIGHQLPALLPDLERAFGLADLGNIVLHLEQRTQERGKFLCTAPALAERVGHLVEILHADQLAGEVQQIAAILRPEKLQDEGRGRLQIFPRVIAMGFLQPRPRPAIDRQRRRFRGVEQRRLEMAREDKPRVWLERM